ncbi:MAG: hypothetical protein ACPHCJ_11270 [Oceanococcaceae bacterium]
MRTVQTLFTVLILRAVFACLEQVLLRRRRSAQSDDFSQYELA